MLQRAIDFLTSPGYVVGVLSTASVSMFAYLARSYARVIKSWLVEVRTEVKKAESRDAEALVQQARVSERILLGVVLDELRARLRVQTSLLLSLLVLLLGGGILFLYLESESTLALPVSLSIGLVLVTMCSVVLFVVSLADEGDAGRNAKLLVEILDEEKDRDGEDGEDARP